MTQYLVNVPVADLRKEPIPAKFSYDRDMLMESQLLFNESVIGHKEQGPWVYVEAIEQQKHSEESGWTGYPGWVLKEQLIETSSFPAKNFVVADAWTTLRREPFEDSQIILSVCMGTRFNCVERLGEWAIVKLPDGSHGALKTSPNHDLSVIDTAKRMLSQPYLWGGRSFYNAAEKEYLTACDCSGLVGLVYSIHGKQLPRDAHDQFLRCQPVNPRDMVLGDLIFQSDQEKPRKNHVMLYAGGDTFIDTNITDKKAVFTTAEARFGIPFAKMEQNQNIGKIIVSFGSLKGENHDNR